ACCGRRRIPQLRKKAGSTLQKKPLLPAAQGIEAEQKRLRVFVGADSPVRPRRTEGSKRPDAPRFPAEMLNC
ncbi:MAG: hypothetical protein LBL20_04205, partial [Treponema sp.]|nr:hypothetical protein [Treponema sp.]